MKLLDACELIVDCPHSTAKDEGSGYPLIRTPNVGRGRLKLEGVHRVSYETYCARNERAVPQTDDLILAREAPVGNVAIIKDGQQVCLGQRTVLIRPNKNIVEPDFLVYYLLSPEMQHVLLSSANGATVSHLNMADIRKLEIRLPDLEVQKKIGRLLSTIEDKIETNNEINDNLLQQAQTIYRDMFITNANPSWRIGQLSDLITVRYGKDHKKLAEGAYPVYGSGGVMRFVERPLYDKESVLIPRKGTLNNVMYVNEPFWSVDTMFFTEMKLHNVAKFVFHFVKSIDLASLNAGSAVPSMTTDILNTMVLPIPDVDTLAKFESVVAPMYQTMQQNTQESLKLAELRESLLPRVMTGELDVSKLDI